MKNKLNDKKVFLVFMIMLGLTFIIFGTTYAFFTYSKDGIKTVTLDSSNAVKLHYQEGANQINIPSGLPMDDTRGKAQEDYFEFTITGETSTFAVPYIIAARVSTVGANRIPDEYISVYLTEVNSGVESQVLFTTYDQLTQISKNNHIEEKLYDTVIPVNTANYTKTYRLRLWINTTANYTPTEENGVQIYPMQDKELALTVNVYTEAANVVASCGVEPNDRYCFDSECFRVIDADCSGNTILLAERNLNTYGEEYISITGLQFSDISFFAGGEDYFEGSSVDPFIKTKETVELNGLSGESFYWFNQFGANDSYPGDFDASTDIPYPYVYDASKTNEEVTISYWGYPYCENGDCLGYRLNNYENILKTYMDSFPANAKVRLLSKEEADLAQARSIRFPIGLSFWLGSLANETTDSQGSSLEVDDYMWVSNGYTSRQEPVYNYVYSESTEYAVRAAIEVPTASLPQSAKLVTPSSTPYVFPKAQSIATTFGFDYDDMNINYELVYGYIKPAGTKYELIGYSNQLGADLYVIELLSNTPLSWEDEALYEARTTLFNYLVSIADEGKIYDENGNEVNTPPWTFNYEVDYYCGIVPINGVEYYYHIDAISGKNHYLFGQYESSYYIELSTSKFWNS